VLSGGQDDAEQEVPQAEQEVPQAELDPLRVRRAELEFQAEILS
jgi:hypothetical protein